jgi:N4-gp56 family major capsid protein
MSVNTFSGNFSADAVTYIAQKTLLIALRRLAIYQLCDKVPMPKNNSLTFQYTRYERFALPQYPLSEGVTPTGIPMTITPVQAVMSQWGAIVQISDISIDTVKHPVLQKAIDLMAHQSQETIDRECAKVALSGANVYYPNPATTSRSGIAATDYVTSTVIGRVVSVMRNYGAMPYDEGEDLYVGVVDSFVNDDISVDSTFVDAAKYGMIKKLLVNEIGEWKGVRWVRSNTIPFIGLLAGGSAASSATAGSLSSSTEYDAVLTIVDALTGYEVYVSAVFSATTGVGASSIQISVPALPSDATPGSTYNLYFGPHAGILYLAQTGLLASGSYNQGVVPLSGAVAPATPASGFKTHFTLVFGKEAISCVELEKIHAFITPAVPTDSDPLVQRRTVGWKALFKAVITNDNFMARIESASINGNTGN